jgi:hypothetical protein
MGILTARLGELLTIAGLNAATLRSDRLRGIAVAAFGSERPVLEERCLLLDGVAWLIRDDLNERGMPHRGAATVTRAFWPEWAEAVARVEHRREPIVFAVAEREEGAWWCGNGRADKLADFVASQPPLKRLLCVNLADILDGMNKRAAKAGFDLSNGSYCLPPDDSTFVRWLKEFRAKRAAMQKLFDPLHAKVPPRPNAAQRAAIEALSCSLH